MKDKLQEIRAFTLERLNAAADAKALDELRVAVLGKKGELTQLLKSISSLSQDERPQAGKMINELREFIEEKMDEAKTKLLSKAQEIQLSAENIDVTMPGRYKELGRRHPVTLVTDEMKRIFIGMGYEVAEGPDIETDYYNFEALNHPDDHPARDVHDTFYIDAAEEFMGKFVLRTHTSPVQVRTLETRPLPIRVIVPGRVFRADEVDATHSPVFHQIEGMVVDKGVTMGDLKGSLEVFARELLGAHTKIRFRPHFFPFTEPSAEVDASCFACKGIGCRTCKGQGWIEMLGCGMVHPNVLRMSGVDPAVYSGFAFGMG
ncbi:MAG: phenylalanine--tRNA ligase subunit alpha, partial [Defluviitaleaceae bacterium]|nr:phenylalanine--tRNA ligase subunit alpha [Defluviitaleaceae bacterium]